MSRIQRRFEDLHAQGRTALIPFITAGDPDPSITVGLMHALVEAGADIVELGVPFSDPMADGPVIQKAAERALEQGVSYAQVLDMVRRFRDRDPDTPVVLMGYLNPYEVIGYAESAEAAARAGVDGLLVVDLPPEEAADWLAELGPRGLDPIFLLSPTSDEARMEVISQVAGGFVYYVSLKGVTGAGHLDVDAVAEKLGQIRAYTDLPIGVGFGIRDAESAARVGAVADAVVVGSALVSLVERHGDDPQALRSAMAELLGGMRAALDQAKQEGPS